MSLIVSSQSKEKYVVPNPAIAGITREQDGFKVMLAVLRDGSLDNEGRAEARKVIVETLPDFEDTPEYEKKANAAYADQIKAAEKELHELIDLGDIKQAVIDRAKGYKRVRKTRELRTEKPMRPPLSSLDKPALIKYARDRLALRLKTMLSKGGMILKIEEDIEKKTKTRLVTTRQEEEQMPADIPAARMVLGNIGPKDEQWTDKQRVDIESESLVDIIAKTGILNK